MIRDEDKCVHRSKTHPRRLSSVRYGNSGSLGNRTPKSLESIRKTAEKNRGKKRSPEQKERSRAGALLRYHPVDTEETCTITKTWNHEIPVKRQCTQRFFDDSSRIRFKSNWEILAYRVLSRMINDIKYESLRLNYLVGEKQHVYIPDFVSEHLKTIFEVKGYMHCDATDKLSRVRASHPEYSLVIVSSSKQQHMFSECCDSFISIEEILKLDI